MVLDTYEASEGSEGGMSGEGARAPEVEDNDRDQPRQRSHPEQPDNSNGGDSDTINYGRDGDR